MKYSVADSVLIRMLMITRMVANKFGPCALSVLQAMVMEVEVLVVASHLTQTLLPCTLILEVCSDWKNDTLLINSGGCNVSCVENTSSLILSWKYLGMPS